MIDNGAVFPSLEHCVDSIDAAYERLGHRLGWRFLTGPRRTFTDRTPFGLITLNPGGTHEDPEHPRSSSEKGSAYWIESWEGSLRVPNMRLPVRKQHAPLSAFWQNGRPSCGPRTMFGTCSLA